MKKLILFLIVLPAAAFTQNKDKQQILALNEQWINSYPSRDTTTLNRIFANDFILVSPKGAKMSKQDVIRNVLSPNQSTVSIRIDSADVRIFDNTGLITAYTTFVLVIDGKRMEATNCYSDLYAKRNGKWVAVAAHVTLLSMKQENN